jgi:hypothetical protein
MDFGSVLQHGNRSCNVRRGHACAGLGDELRISRNVKVKSRRVDVRSRSRDVGFASADGICGGCRRRALRTPGADSRIRWRTTVGAGRDNLHIQVSDREDVICDAGVVDGARCQSAAGGRLRTIVSGGDDDGNAPIVGDGIENLARFGIFIATAASAIRSASAKTVVEDRNGHNTRIA